MQCVREGVSERWPCDDADTVGSVAGQLAGGLYGYSEVPRHLKDGLLKERQIYVTAQLLSGARPLSQTVR